MTTIDATGLLRPGLLRGVSALLAGELRAASFAASVNRAFVELGASVSLLAPIEDSPRARGEDDDGPLGELVTAALAELGTVDMLVLDSASGFAPDAAGPSAGDAPEAADDGDRAALRMCLQDAWSVTRAVVNLAFLPSGRGGRILYIAPRPHSGSHAGAARAGLENLARTLSIEWARHAITAVAIAPGVASTEEEVSAVAAYLASPAGGFFSGCLLDLRGPVGV